MKPADLVPLNILHALLTDPQLAVGGVPPPFFFTYELVFVCIQYKTCRHPNLILG